MDNLSIYRSPIVSKRFSISRIRELRCHRGDFFPNIVKLRIRMLLDGVFNLYNNHNSSVKIF